MKLRFSHLDCRVELPAVCTNGFRHRWLLLGPKNCSCTRPRSLTLFPTCPFSSSSRKQLCTRSKPPLPPSWTTSRLPMQPHSRDRLSDGGSWCHSRRTAVCVCACVAKLLSNLSLSVYTSKECCQIWTGLSPSLNASWGKMENTGLFWKTQT